MKRIDLNCDLGEGFPFDGQLLPLINTANVSCGGHAGHPGSMYLLLQLAKTLGVQVGAHPSFPDPINFGRFEQSSFDEALEFDIEDQIRSIRFTAGVVGIALRYLKPHGALYNQACRDRAFADPLIGIARRHGLAVMGLPNSALAQAASAAKVRFIPEGFADRRYRADGSLVPRTELDALVVDPAEAVRQAERLIREFGVETICVHGDNPHAVEFVQALRSELLAKGFTLRAFDPGESALARPPASVDNATTACTPAPEGPP